MEYLKGEALITLFLAPTIDKEPKKITHPVNQGVLLARWKRLELPTFWFVESIRQKTDKLPFIDI